MSQGTGTCNAGEPSPNKHQPVQALRGFGVHEYLLMPLLHLGAFSALLWLYLDGIVPVFGFNGYLKAFHGTMNALNESKLAIAASLAFLLPLTIPRSTRPSTLFLHIILALTLAPSLVLYAAANLPNGFMLISVAAFLIVCAISHCLPLKVVEISGVDSKTMLLVLVLALFAFVMSFAILGGFRFLNFDIRRVYEFRTAASENLPWIYGYLVSGVSKALIPFVIALACAHRAFWLALLATASSVLLFGLTANKEPLFIPIMVFCVYYFYRFGRIQAWFVFAIICAAIVSNFAIQAYRTSGSELGVWVGAIIGNRVLMLPSLINYAYFDQFSEGARYWWSESRLTFGLVAPPFPRTSANLIGMNYFGHAETFANTGWIGSGYAQAGALGVILYSIGMGIVFLLIDGIAKGFGSRTTVAMFIVLVLAMITSSDFVTMFLTHGMLLGLLLAKLTNGKHIRGLPS